MTEARSKRRVLPLIFIDKSFKKPLLLEESRLKEVRAKIFQHWFFSETFTT